jgi:hypothetical protein
LNATVRDQEIAEYQLKSPFNLLQMDSNGALISEKWALLYGIRTFGLSR